MLENRAELEEMLRRPQGLGRVLARHAYGMGRWVDLFALRIPSVPDPRLKELVARVVADNARHMVLFRDRAAAHGVDPDAYTCPAEGEVIYERLAELDLEESIAYALGSLEHFADLLAAYAQVAEGDDAAVVDTVRAETAQTIALLRPLVEAPAAPLASEAHERYRLRELVETPLYAHAG
jgi:hypothetical protein